MTTTRRAGRDLLSAPAALRMALPTFTAAIFTGAVLLFWVQPMFGKMALPLLGGAPAVWNTALLFFQTALLAGYLYAHGLAHWLSPRHQVVVHLGLLAIGALALPLAIGPGWTPPTEGTPVFWLIALLTLTVGAPYAIVSATSPLLQRWFAGTRHPAARDPYFLYVASNAGSLIGLLGYPLLFEPAFSLLEQSLAWTAGYILLATLIGAAGVVLLRAPARPAAGATARASEREPAAQVTWADRGRWLAFAFVPSSLLLGVTSHITTDIAAAPLLWVGPLALYLITFMIVFAQRPLVSRPLALRLETLAILGLAVSMWFGNIGFAGIAIHMIGVFLITLGRHSELAGLRPAARHLTEFYVIMSLGGALGGAFNAILAPQLFNAVYEYPLALVLAALTRVLVASPAASRPRLVDASLPAAALTLIALSLALGTDPRTWPATWVLGLLVPAALGLYALQARPWGYALGLATLLGLLQVMKPGPGLQAQERSFFGTYRVNVDPTGSYRMFVHGTTIHGAQALAPGREREPLLYFNTEGPLGQAFSVLQAARPALRIGIVGLGIGGTVCYRRPADDLTLYEIDPVVVDLARDPRLFTYMRDCAADAPVFLGDARLALEARPRGTYDVLVLDAFSSDSVPTHLLTREAVQLYLERLAPGGVAIFNVTNRYLTLEPVLARIAAEEGLAAIGWKTPTTREMTAQMQSGSHWVVIARSQGDLAAIKAQGAWRQLAGGPDDPLWTDDHSDLLSVIGTR